VIPISYNIRNLAVRKTTSIAAGLGLTLVVFVIAAALMLQNGVRKALGRSADPNGAIVLRKGSEAELSSSIDEPNVGLVLATPGVARLEDGKPDGTGELMIVVLLDKLGTSGFSNVQVRGVSDNVMSFRKTVHVIAGRAPQPGTDEVMIGRAIRGRFKGVELGQSFDLKKNRPVSVVGVFEDGGSSFESEVWGDKNTIRTTFGREGLVSSVRLRLENPSKFDGFKASLESNRQLGLEAYTEQAYYERLSSQLAGFVFWLGVAIAFFFSVGAMIGAMITMYAAVSNRQREIGTLRALGFSKVSIIGSFLLESILLALAGGAVGTLLSFLLGLIRISLLNPLSWSELVITFEPNAQIITTSVIAAAVMGLLGGLFPAIRAARVNPIQAMRA
jgi:putative ABC transport system permease protein